MRECYLGADIGSISTKAVVVNDDAEIIASTYQWTEGDPINAINRVIREIKRQLAGNWISKQGSQQRHIYKNNFEYE